MECKSFMAPKIIFPKVRAVDRVKRGTVSAASRNVVFSGLFWSFGERLCSQGVSFVVSIVLARILSPHDYGIIALVLIFISLADVFVNSGFSTSLVQDKNADETDFSTIFYCSFAVSIAIYFLLFFCAPLIANFYRQPILIPVIRVFSLRVPLSVYNSIQHAYVSRHMIFKKFFFSTLIGTISSGIIGIIMAYGGFGVWALIAQYFSMTIVDTLVLAVTVRWHLQLKFSWSRAKSLMSFGWKIFVADLSGVFFDRLRSLIVGRIYTPADLACYNKGEQFPTLITTNISSAIMNVLFPAIADSSDNYDHVRTMTRRAMQVSTYVIFPLMVGLAAVARPLVRILLTDKWLASVPILQVLSIASAVGVIGEISLQTLKGVGRSDVVLKLEFIKKPVYVLLLFVGAKVSVNFLAITMVLYNVYSVGVNFYQLKKYIHYPIFQQLKDLIPTLLLSVGMGIVIFPLSFMITNMWILLFTQVILGVLSYLLLSIIFKNSSYQYVKSYFASKLGK